MNINKEIFNNIYSEDILSIKLETVYSKRVIHIRFSLIERFGSGREILDLCCGDGSYLIPVLDRVRSAVGVDFSEKMLEGFRKKLDGKLHSHLLLVKTDIERLPFLKNSFDFVFCYSSLYYVADVKKAIQEVSRVLRFGGYAVLELGNLYSLNTVVCNTQHENLGLPKPFHISYRNMHCYLKEAGLEIMERRSFQILPMYGTPKRLFYLYPLLCSYWKKIFGIQIRGKMLDEWISGSWPLRYLAFRHLFLVRKK